MPCSDLRIMRNMCYAQGKQTSHGRASHRKDVTEAENDDKESNERFSKNWRKRKSANNLSDPKSEPTHPPVTARA